MSSRRALEAPVLRRGANRSRRLLHRLEPGPRLQPSFLVVGGKRCGSTALHDAIVAHPDVLAPYAAKGSHFFDMNYGRGRRWFDAHFPSVAAARRHERRTGRYPITGESSPYYSFHPTAPQRIAAELPDVTLIMSVRDPIERAWSQYRYAIERGFENLPFRMALDREEERLAANTDRLASEHGSRVHRHQTYLARGRYIEHLEVLAAAVGRSQIHVIVAEEMFRAPGPVFDELWRVLGLEPFPTPLLPRTKSAPPAPIDDDDRRFLGEYFDPYNGELEAWLGRALPWGVA